jgi:hypothetical protein
MNLLQLRATVAAYHRKEPADLIKGPVDLFLVAANNAKKKAEKNHNFNEARCTAVLAIDGVTGGALSSATIAPVGVFSGIKEILDISGLRAGGEFIPLDFTRPEVNIERDRYELELSDTFWPNNRYPSDAQVINRRGNAALVLRGGSIYRFPQFSPTMSSGGEALTVYIEGYGWLKDYTETQLDGDADGAPEDFLLDHGFEFLQWEIIIELNYIFHTYVFRQEGNVGSPDKKRDEAWADLIRWDTYLVDPNSTRSR